MIELTTMVTDYTEKPTAAHTIIRDRLSFKTDNKNLFLLYISVLGEHSFPEQLLVAVVCKL